MGYCYDKNYKKSLILDGYLNKCPPEDDVKYRQLDEADKPMLCSIGKMQKNFGHLITELFAIKQILEYLDATELHCLVQNFLRIIVSLKRQRDKLLLLKITFLAVRPREEELAEIERFLTYSQNRINHIQEKFIPWNLEYSPIKEYLEIRQSKDFQGELYGWFGDIKAIFYASKYNPKEIKEYAEYIANTVSDAGRMDEYKSRVRGYAKRREEIGTKTKNEKESEKLAKERALLMQRMDVFQRAFNNSVSMLVGDDLIGIGSGRTVVRKIYKHGRSVVFVLCCYIHNGRCMYRYLGENNSIVKTFASAYAFENIAAASEAKSRIEVQYPRWVFSIATLPEI